jgi:hypothetical protein
MKSSLVKIDLVSRGPIYEINIDVEIGQGKMVQRGSNWEIDLDAKISQGKIIK